MLRKKKVCSQRACVCFHANVFRYLSVCTCVCVCVELECVCVDSTHCVHSFSVESEASFSLTFSIWPPEESYDN